MVDEEERPKVTERTERSHEEERELPVSLRCGRSAHPTMGGTMQDASVRQVLDWCNQVQHFGEPVRELLVHSIALEERTGDRRTLRILIGPQMWSQLTEQLRLSIGLSVCMGMAGVRWYGRVTFAKTVTDPLTTRAWVEHYRQQ